MTRNNIESVVTGCSFGTNFQHNTVQARLQDIVLYEATLIFSSMPKVIREDDGGTPFIEWLSAGALTYDTITA